MLLVRTRANVRQAAEHLYCALMRGKRKCGHNCKSRMGTPNRPKAPDAVIRHSLSGRVALELECVGSDRTPTGQLLRHEGSCSGNGVSFFSRLSSLWRGRLSLDESILVDVFVTASVSARGKFPC